MTEHFGYRLDGIIRLIIVALRLFCDGNGSSIRIIMPTPPRGSFYVAYGFIADVGTGFSFAPDGAGSERIEWQGPACEFLP